MLKIIRQRENKYSQCPLPNAWLGLAFLCFSFLGSRNFRSTKKFPPERLKMELKQRKGPPYRWLSVSLRAEPGTGEIPQETQAMLLLALIRGTNKNRVQFEGNCSFGPGGAHDLLIQPARAWLHPAHHPGDRPGLDPSLLARPGTVRAWQGPRGLSATRDPPWLCLRCRLGGGRGASAEPARPPADPPARRCLSGPGAALGSAGRRPGKTSARDPATGGAAAPHVRREARM